MKREPTIYRSPREKFLREAEREATKQAEHRTRVRFDGAYRAVCSCTWRGQLRATREAAEFDAQEHTA